jgi:hypothetical protein
MNVVITLHQPVCLYSVVLLYSVAGGKVNRQIARTRWTVDHSAPGRWIARALVSAERWTARRLEYFNRFSATSSGKVFFGPSAFRSLWDFFADRARYEKRSSTAKGLPLGACFVAEGPLSKNTFGRTSRKQTQHEGIHRSYEPGSFGIMTCLETKGCTDLKRKRPISPW